MLDKLRGFHHNDTPQIDEHDEPTEPMRRAEVAAFIPTIPDSALSPDEDVPSAKSSTQPFPHQYVQPSSSLQGGVQQTPPYPVSPVMPGTPRENSPIPPGQSEVANKVVQRKNVFRNMLPLAVGMCFVALQTLLLLRFLLKVFGIFPDNAWVGAVYEVSNVFVLPFHALFLQLAIPTFFTVELYTLLAILAYGVISRILVHILKAFSKAR